VPRNPSSAASDALLASIVSGDSQFGFDLYRVLRTEPGNLFISPYSISTALSMLLAGTRGDTAQELGGALGVGGDLEAWHVGRNRLELELIALSGLELPDNPDAVPLTLEPTNGFFGRTGYPFKQPFLDTLAANYGAGAQSVDFSRSEEARAAINEWVAQRTRDRIQELLPQGFVDSMTVAVLVNAIYFKANWLQTFNPDMTRAADFHLLDGGVSDVQMMRSNNKMQYAAGDGWQAVELPYAGGASMLVIVPDVGQFGAIEAALDATFIDSLGDAMSEHQVLLGLPRWETESELDLIPPLEALGIELIFGGGDLTGIADAGLFVSGVQHAANITVDEKGTEAAAATAIAVRENAAPPVTLNVDRPFIYLIRDDANGEILFLGRLIEV
jgi:serpin B